MKLQRILQREFSRHGDENEVLFHAADLASEELKLRECLACNGPWSDLDDGSGIEALQGRCDECVIWRHGEHLEGLTGFELGEGVRQRRRGWADFAK